MINCRVQRMCGVVFQHNVGDQSIQKERNLRKKQEDVPHVYSANPGWQFLIQSEVFKKTPRALGHRGLLDEPLASTGASLSPAWRQPNSPYSEFFSMHSKYFKFKRIALMRQMIAQRSMACIPSRGAAASGVHKSAVLPKKR